MKKLLILHFVFMFCLSGCIDNTTSTPPHNTKYTTFLGDTITLIESYQVDNKTYWTYEINKNGTASGRGTIEEKHLHNNIKQLNYN